MRRAHRLPSTLALAPLLACASAATVSAGGAAPVGTSPPATPVLRAAVARVDVTPPPGLATFGHGPDAHVTDGYWTRLYCRVFVIETTPADRHAIVPCDLAAISDRLHRAVAEKTARFLVPAPRLMLTATHTHAGPAHYFESIAYGGAVSSRLPGYDENVVEFLAGRIADGVSKAVAALRPAAARWVHTTAWGISRNRSLVAFRANAPSTFTPRETPDPRLPADMAAVDPALDVLQLEEIDGGRPPRRLGPIGWLVFFGMHPTVLPASNRLFGADADGVASRRIEAELRRAWAAKGGGCREGEEHDPLAGLVNTNEGDLSPVWRRGDVAEAVEVGRKLADAALRTLDPGVPVANGASADTFRTDLAPESRYVELDLPGRPLPRGGDSLCDPPRMGQASGHGGSDHRASIDGLIDSGSDLDLGETWCQAPKPQLLGWLSVLLVGLRARTFFPTHLAFALVHLGDTWLSFVPAEMTVHAGAAVNRAVLEAAGTKGKGAPTAVVAGLANGYMQYVATRAEYQLQYYEGGSTLYGPASADFFAQVMAELTLDMLGDAHQPDSPAMGRSVTPRYTFAASRRALPAPDEPPRTARFQPLSLCTIAESSPPALCFRWTHGEPGQVPLTTAPWIELVGADGRARGAGASGACDPAAVIDDRGVDFQTRVRERSACGLVWSTVFQPSGEEWARLSSDASTHRIRARGAGAIAAVGSPDFSFRDLPRPCTAAQVLYCLAREQVWEGDTCRVE